MAVNLKSLGVAGSAAASLTISGSTNATPIVATLGAGHGLKNGDRIAVSGVTGNTGANGIWTLAFTGENTAQLVGSVGNGSHGGTVRVGLVCDDTPLMEGHSAMLETFGNGVATLLLEGFASYDDFAAGRNDDGASPPILTSSGVTQAGATAGATAASSSVVIAATAVGYKAEIKLPRILRASLSAYTSGSVHVRIVG